MQKINIGSMTQEECLEFAQELIPHLLEENQWKLVDQLAEILDADEIVANLTRVKEEG